MKRVGAFVVLLLFATTVSVSAAEQMISKNQVPDTVLKSFSKMYPNATVKSYAKETKNGKTYYEIESKEGSVSRDLLFEPNGNLVELEENIPYDSLPSPVRDTISTKYGKNSFVSAERVTKNKQTTYGVTVKMKNKKQEMFFNPDGSQAKDPESAEEEKTESK